MLSAFLFKLRSQRGSTRSSIHMKHITYNIKHKTRGGTHVTSYKLRDSQDGVTLVISIILLASVTFISFALSTLILREISATRLILRTEPAISAANAGGEVAIYRLFRESGNVSATGGTLSQSGAVYDIAADLYDNPYLFTIPPNGVISVGLYDAENPNNKITDYGSVTITNNAGGSTIRISLVSWSDPGTELWCSSLTMNAGATSVTCSLASLPDDRYLLTIENIPSCPACNAIGQVRALDESGQPKGVPSDNPQIEVTGTSGEVERKIRIDIQ